MDNIWILANVEGDGTSLGGIESDHVKEGAETQASTKIPSDSNTPPVTTQRKPFGNSSLIFIALMFILMYFILFRSPRKKQQQHKQMVQSLQKNDRIRTIGGIIGTVVDIKGDEITLKVDESSNTKIKIVSSAIGKNLSKDK